MYVGGCALGHFWRSSPTVCRGRFSQAAFTVCNGIKNLVHASLLTPTTSSCDHLICKIYITVACFVLAVAFCNSLSIRPCFHHGRSPMLISLCHLIRASFFWCLLESDWPRMSSCVTFRGNLHIWHEIEQLNKDTSEEWSGSTLPGWRPWSTKIANLLARPIPCLFFSLTLAY